MSAVNNTNLAIAAHPRIALVWFAALMSAVSAVEADDLTDGRFVELRSCQSTDEAIRVFSKIRASSIGSKTVFSRWGKGDRVLDRAYAKLLRGILFENPDQKGREEISDDEWAICRAALDAVSIDHRVGSDIFAECVGDRLVSLNLEAGNSNTDSSRTFPDRFYRDVFVKHEWSQRQKVFLVLVICGMLPEESAPIRDTLYKECVDPAWDLCEQALWDNGPYIKYSADNRIYLVDKAARKRREHVPANEQELPPLAPANRNQRTGVIR